MNKIPLAYADVELQLAAAISIGDTSITLSSANDDDGNALPAGKYCFTVDNGSSNKEYLLGQLNGTNLTSVVSVSRQGVESSGAARAHRVGAPAILSDFAAIQRVVDILRGQETVDGANPISYDAEPTLTDRKELATVAYVLDNITGGTVAFDSQIVTGVNAGETVAAGELVYFKTSDQEWYLADASVAAEVNGVHMGIALGAGTDGAAITGGVQISGSYTTTGLTAGATYYATDTAGTIGTTAGTTNRVIGVALSTTELLIVPVTPESLTTDEKAALAGGGAFGTPDADNKLITEAYVGSRFSDVVTFAASGTWTKDTGLKRIRVQAWGGGGSGGARDTDHGGGGGGGGYSDHWFEASELGATETVTIGAGGAGASGGFNVGGNTTFGTLLTAWGGGGGLGRSSSSESNGGGGGGADRAGNNANTSTGGTSGIFASDGGNAENAEDAFYGAGGGSYSFDGGASIYGGGGGGASDGGVGGTSVHGGAGGDEDEDGSVPGGGGGGSSTATAGNGGNGQVIVTEYYS